jgi:hypothetical protein
MRAAPRRYHRLLLCDLLTSVVVATYGTAKAAQPSSVTVVFNPINDSGVKGTATLTADGDKTIVELSVTGVRGHHPDHIHRSTCANPEPVPTYPLSDVVLNPADVIGHSTTTVDVSLEQLLNEPYLILIHKSHEEIDVYLACADITASTPMPATGAGSGGDSNGSQSLLIITGILSTAALVVFAGGIDRRRKPRLIG